MTLVQKPEEIQEAIGQIKAVASQFCTNFFPAASRLEDWLQRGCLFIEKKPETVFIFREDRDLFHFYFAAANRAVLEKETAAQTAPSGSARLILDLLGKDLLELTRVLERAHWGPYQRLMRLARGGQPHDSDGKPGEANVITAEERDLAGIQRLIEERFDPLADQIPGINEIRTAREAGQILVLREDGEVAALLFFETIGFTSTIRYWVVGSAFESRGFGSQLLRAYLKIHASVKRFLLWVNEKNDNAIQKYRHFGYQPDGLKDQVLLKDFAHA
jgi:GNAT superfamily N-acetyltransferase